ncbi:hypothetical protein BJF90_37580 [Pseudonocardia sp. CNS-004]|nr:hypothetical protein BJF90_37580 [Pseudonocardia sp. CNS-004]
MERRQPVERAADPPPVEPDVALAAQGHRERAGVDRDRHTGARGGGQQARPHRGDAHVGEGERRAQHRGRAADRDAAELAGSPSERRPHVGQQIRHTRSVPLPLHGCD